MDQCVIWGSGIIYESILNQVMFEIKKNNIEVIAIISNSDYTFSSSKDGFPVLPKEELYNLPFDYLIIASIDFYDEIKEEAILFGIKQNVIINGNIFNMPCFDWKRYISLVKEPITILSNDCWGGYIYHKLYLPFSSPCINILWERESYIKFAQNPEYYFGQSLEIEQEGNIRYNQCPIGKIGYGNKKIKMNFVHTTNFQEAEILWNRRKKRINKSRIFVEFALPANIDNCNYLLEEFDKIQFPKICFYSDETDIKGVVYLPRFEWYVNQGKRADTLMFNDYIRSIEYLLKDIDILKLLNGEKDYIRTI